MGQQRIAGALDQVIAAGIQCLAQGVADDAEVGDPLLDLGQLGRSPRLQAGRASAAAVVVAADLEQVGYLGQGEAEPLRGLDHPELGDGLGRIEPVPAQAAIGAG